MGKSVDIHHLGLLLVLRAPAYNERLRRLLRLELSKIPWVASPGVSKTTSPT